MRKLSKMLALGLAMVLTFGMTVSADDSVTTGTTNAETEALGNEVTGGAVKGVEGATVVFDDIYAEDLAVAEDLADGDVVAGRDVTPVDANGNVLTGEQTVTLNVPEVKLGRDYIALHKGSNGWETLPVVVLADGKIEVTSDDWSPIFILEVEEEEDVETPEEEPKNDTAAVVSPKTGEVMPIASVMAVICLAGLAVCAKKARD